MSAHCKVCGKIISGDAEKHHHNKMGGCPSPRPADSMPCSECGGDHESNAARVPYHEPNADRVACVRYWKLRALQAENQLLVTRIYRTALKRIRSFPVHSEPVGGAWAMKDIADDALSPLGGKQ